MVVKLGLLIMFSLGCNFYHEELFKLFTNGHFGISLSFLRNKLCLLHVSFWPYHSCITMYYVTTCVLQPHHLVSWT